MSADSRGAPGADILASSGLEKDAAAELDGRVADASDAIATSASKAVESHDETTSPTGVAADGAVPEITNQESQTTPPVAPGSSEDAESSASVLLESAISEKETPGAAPETLLRIDAGEEEAATVSDAVLPSNDVDPQRDEVTETASRVSETNMPSETQPSAEVEVTDTDQSETAALEQEPLPEKIKTPLGFGIIDEIFNFADALGANQVHDAEQAFSD